MVRSRFRLLPLAISLALVCSLAFAQDLEVGELYAADALVRGSFVFVAGGMKVMSGSSVVAGEDTALLRLSRGGEVRFCSHTTASVASTQPARSLMVGINSGALEVNYNLPASADALVTPDFRILLEGPGQFHFGMATDSKGNTCMRSLPGNTGSVTVTELMGDETYKVKPDEQVSFRNGRVANRDASAPPDCGCPAPPPVLRVENIEPNPEPPKNAGKASILTVQELERLSAQEPEAAPATLASTTEVHVQVDAPFVFQADDPEPSPLDAISQLRLPAPPRLHQEVMAPFQPMPRPTPITPTPITKVPSDERPRRAGFLGRVGAFFASIFR